MFKLVAIGIVGPGQPRAGRLPARTAARPTARRRRPRPREEGRGRRRRASAGPAGDLRKAYDLLRRLRADDRPAGRPEERLRDWTDRAAKLYRDGLKAFEDGDDRLAHEYGAAAHDLARAVDHARNAARFDQPDPDLPPPPDGPGPEDAGERARRDLRRAYDRIAELRRRGRRADAEVLPRRRQRPLQRRPARRRGRPRRAGRRARPRRRGDDPRPRAPRPRRRRTARGPTAETDAASRPSRPRPTKRPPRAARRSGPSAASRDLPPALPPE